MTEIDCDILIIGAGLVGLTTALACAYKGARVTVIDGMDPRRPDGFVRDGRAYAIAATGYQMLDRLGVIARLPVVPQPMADIEISDGEVGALSPLQLYFKGAHYKNAGGSGAASAQSMGYMIENCDLQQACLEAALDQDRITLTAPMRLGGHQMTSGHVDAQLSNGEALRASLLVAADGRRSRLRQFAGIGVQGWNYKQKALTTTLTHTKDHGGLAREIFFPNGPLALLPLTGQRSHIVWTDTPRAIDAALVLGMDAFTDELARRIDGLLGDIELDGPRQAFLLSLQMADHYSADRLVLVGDAAHVIHPIAGQGLNMGLRDGAALADIIAEAKSVGLDIGGAALADYGAWRNFDNTMLAASTDIFNRLFSNNIAPLKHARRLALGALNFLPSAQAFFMREASGQTGHLPSLLR